MRFRATVVAFFALFLSFALSACSNDMAVGDGPMTYEEVMNTGLANNCPTVDSVTRGTIPLEPDLGYRIEKLCLQPTNFYVKEEGTKRREATFVEGRLLTRKTSSIDQVSGALNIKDDGSLEFVEEDGFDFQAATVLLPGGEEVPFLFTIKRLVASTQSGVAAVTSSTDFEGAFRVPSYRGASFLDPKGRGIKSGYDNAVALPAGADSEELAKENVKTYDVGEGTISLQVTKVDAATNEIAGTFVSFQPSDTDLGSKEPLDMKILGTFYAIVEEAV